MHIGRALLDVAQPRCLELAAITRHTGDLEASFIRKRLRCRVPANPKAVKSSIGKIEAGMARRAAATKEKDVGTALRLARERIGIPAVAPAIVRSIAAPSRADEIGER